ncbi:MAG: M23 family metallopeptidase [Gammaproteobacteria bacterium]|nr:M23 family metallopeptidase [Gammaproteobacteria bacterium]
MNIILITKKGRQRRHIDLNSFGHYVLCGLVLIGFCAGLAGFGYWLGAQRDPNSYVMAWKSELESQRGALVDLKATSQARIEALTMRLGQMHGHITRLDALGAKLVKMAKLDAREFEFQNPPALGGPSESLGEAQSEDDGVWLQQAIEGLSSELGQREQQLVVLEGVLQTRSLQEEVYPAGQPIKNGWVSSSFGFRNSPFGGRREFHKGVDIAAQEGTRILAAAGGVVTWADRRWGYGNLVEINHGNGYSTRYGHCSQILVKEGEAIKKGQAVALVGSTGRSTGPHLHFEVLQAGRQVDPSGFVQASAF